ncbi:MAG TPA: DUF4124 domain-containing protein [Myxococcota bacterium]|nr:DUF4124 domain-containing protein [Myxococcota bacterium]
MNARAVSRCASVIVLAVALLLAASAFLARPARAQAYKYKDSSGHVHFTEDYYEIPERYRNQIETREMPVHVDPNAAGKDEAPLPGGGAAAASFENGVAHGMGGNLTVKQQDALHAWMKKWVWPWVAAMVVNVIIALAMVIHAFVQGKIGWGLANFFLGVTSPFYMMMHLEQSLVVRVGLLFLYLSPMIVGGIAGAELAAALR